MNNKRLAIVLIALIVIALVLAACGPDNKSGNAQSTPVPTAGIGTPVRIEAFSATSTPWPTPSQFCNQLGCPVGPP